MSYTPQTWDAKTWEKGQVVLQNMLNHMETGISTGGGSAGKNWYEVDLSINDIKKLVVGGQIVKNFTTPYDATTFKNDYFLCKIDQTAQKDGALLFPDEAMERVYVNTDGLTNILSYLMKSLTELMGTIAFDYHYYKTLVLYAGCASTSKGVFNGSLDDKNVIYLQDISQQEWEHNTELASVISVKPGSREDLGKEEFGKAFVIHIKGATLEYNFIYCLQSSQAAYWDTTDSTTKWANMEAGKFYQVYFDTQHDTERWLVTPTTVEGKIWATEMASSTKTDLLNTGVAFEADKVCASVFVDKSLKLETKCIAPADKYMSRVFSFNDKFTEQGSAAHIEYVGRPIAYNIDTYTYYTEDEQGQPVKHIEKNGEYIWTSDVNGVPINLIIPEKLDEQGKPNRDTYILEMDTSNIQVDTELYRHTFTITPATGATFTTGQYKACLSFSAVNAQAGESSIEYILHSDESQYPSTTDPDWILPVSGIVGQVNSSGSVDTWYTAGRIIAGWKNTGTEETPNYIRCLFIDYINETTGEWVKAEFITDSNKDKFNGRDFRSVIGSFRSPRDLSDVKY